MASAPPTERPCEILTVSRAQPFPIRYGRLTRTRHGAARTADVVYASATYAAAAAAARRHARPLVVKLVSDPAYERARRYRLFDGTLEEFQDGGSQPVAALKRARTAALRRARRVIVPSRYLAQFALGWGLDPERVVVVPNPAPALAVEEANERRGLVFAGRLTRQKALHTALDALALVPEAELLVLGDGPDRERLEQHAAELGLNGRVRFVGSVPRVGGAEGARGRRGARALERLGELPARRGGGARARHAADRDRRRRRARDRHRRRQRPARPARVAGRSGGGDRRFLGSEELREPSRGAARGSVEHLSAPLVYGRIEELLAEAVAR